MFYISINSMKRILKPIFVLLSGSQSPVNFAIPLKYEKKKKKKKKHFDHAIKRLWCSFEIMQYQNLHFSTVIKVMYVKL